MIKRDKRRSSRMYFTKEVENAIVEHNSLDPVEDRHKRSRIYQEKIHPAFYKLAENVMNTWKITRNRTGFEDLKIDTVTELYEKMPKYVQGKGKAYSYFTIVAKNFLIRESMNIYNESMRAEEVNQIDNERDLKDEYFANKKYDEITDFMNLWSLWVDKHLHKLFSNERDISIADSFLELIQNAEDIESFNKKKIYILIRSRSDVPTQYITAVRKKMKKLFFDMYNDYCRDGFIDNDKYLS